MILLPVKTACLLAAMVWGLTPAVALQTPTAASPHAPAVAAKGPRPAKQSTSQLVDVNSAPKDVLVKLPGITPALADQIIAHRPYLSKAKLVTRKVMPLATFQMIRGLIMTMPPAQK